MWAVYYRDGLTTIDEQFYGFNPACHYLLSRSFPHNIDNEINKYFNGIITQRNLITHLEDHFICLWPLEITSSCRICGEEGHSWQRCGND